MSTKKIITLDDLDVTKFKVNEDNKLTFEINNINTESILKPFSDIYNKETWFKNAYGNFYPVNFFNSEELNGTKLIEPNLLINSFLYSIPSINNKYYNDMSILSKKINELEKQYYQDHSITEEAFRQETEKVREDSYKIMYGDSFFKSNLAKLVLYFCASVGRIQKVTEDLISSITRIITYKDFTDPVVIDTNNIDESHLLQEIQTQSIYNDLFFVNKTGETQYTLTLNENFLNSILNLYSIFNRDISYIDNEIQNNKNILLLHKHSFSPIFDGKKNLQQIKEAVETESKERLLDIFNNDKILSRSFSANGIFLESAINSLSKINIDSFFNNQVRTDGNEQIIKDNPYNYFAKRSIKNIMEMKNYLDNNSLTHQRNNDTLKVLESDPVERNSGSTHNNAVSLYLQLFLEVFRTLNEFKHLKEEVIVEESDNKYKYKGLIFEIIQQFKKLNSVESKYSTTENIYGLDITESDYYEDIDFMRRFDSILDRQINVLINEETPNTKQQEYVTLRNSIAQKIQTLMSM